MPRSERDVAREMKKKGYRYGLKMPDDERLLYVKSIQQASELMRATYPDVGGWSLIPIERVIKGEEVPSVIEYRPTGPGKFEGSGMGTVGAWLYDKMLEGWSDDSETEDFAGTGMGSYDLMTFPNGITVIEPDGNRMFEFKASIISEDSQGLVDVSTYGTIKEARNDWKMIQDEIAEAYEEYEREMEEETEADPW